MHEQIQFRGGAFSNQLPKRPTRGTIELRSSSIAFITDSTTLMLPYSECDLEMGGDGGHILFCRNQDRSTVIFCDDRRFPLALKAAAQGALDAEIDQLLGRRRRKRKLSFIINIAALLIFIGLLIGAYYGIMAAARAAVMAMPISVDKTIGDTAIQSMSLEGNKIDDPVVVGAIQHMVDRLQPHFDGGPFDFQVTVVDAPMENAFALPGGQIVIYTGLMKSAKTPEEVAGVLAHEMAHVTQRHGMQRIGQSVGVYVAIGFLFGDVDGLTRIAVDLASSGAINSYSREHESEADAVGTKALHKAGIDPKGLADFFENLEKKHGDVHDVAVWMSSHPQHQTRIQAVRQLVSQLPPQEYQPLDIDWPDVQKRLR